MRVPFFDYTRVYRSEAERYDRVMSDVLNRSDFILRDDLVKFEAALAEYTGVRHAIGVGNGTDAIWISLLAVGVRPGDEVVLPSHTYVATAGAVNLVGAVPVLVDCGDDHLIDPMAVERAITQRTRAIIPVQLNGRTAKMEPLMEIAARTGTPIVEDSAQGLGSTYKGKMAGTFGKAGTYSFFPAKVLGCFGDGGAIVTNDDELGRAMRCYRDHGRDSDGVVRSWGVNSRLDNVQAAILLEKFRTFSRDLERRRSIARIYRSLLGAVPQLLLPPGPDDSDDHYDTFQNYEVEAESRDELREFLTDRGVGTIIQWGGTAVHQIEALGLSSFNLPRTELLFRRAVLLPMNQYMTDDEASHVGETVGEFYRG